MTRFVNSTALFFLAAFVGMWGYVTIASIFGAVEAYWWGGKGWFMPAFGTLLLIISSAPSTWVVPKFAARMSTKPFSFGGLCTVGFLQGFTIFPALHIVSLLVNFVMLTMSVTVQGFAEFVFVVLKVTIAFGLSTLASILIVIWFVNARATKNK